MVLYNKLYNIDKFGHKKHLQKLKPIFQYKQHTMGGNKKHEIIRVAQENLYMLKRLNERTSFYNVEKWNRDYEISQVYKRNHCLYSPIDFNKTQRYGGFNKQWGLPNIQNHNNYTTRKKFFSKTHYSGMGIGDVPESKRVANSTRKRKKFEDFNYRDLQFDEKEKKEDNKLFKKISEIETPEKEQQNGAEEKYENKENKNEDNGQNKMEEKQEEEKNKEKNEEKSNEKEEQKEGEEKPEEKEEEEKPEEKENKDDDNEEQKEQTKNKRDEKEEKEESSENKNKNGSEE